MLLFLQSTFVLAEKRFVVIPKFVHPFFERAHQGCLKAAQELQVACLYQPPQKFDVAEQVKLLSDFLSQDIAGIAIAPISSAAVARAVKASNTRNIPIVTFDSDFKEKDQTLRRSYIGSNNKEIGIALAKLLDKQHPGGGTLAIQAGEPPAENLRERLQGVYETLDMEKWQEVSGSPYYCNADSQVAVQQLEDVLKKHENLTGFIALGAWPQVAKHGYSQAIALQSERVESAALSLLVADTLPMQLDLLAEGKGHGLVGQRPFEMGYHAIRTLLAISNGENVEDIHYTQLDVCTKDTVEDCKKNIRAS